MDSSVFPPIGGAASPWAIRPIEEDVDIFDSSSDKDVAALGKSDPDASDNKAYVTELFSKKVFFLLYWIGKTVRPTQFSIQKSYKSHWLGGNVLKWSLSCYSYLEILTTELELCR